MRKKILNETVSSKIGKDYVRWNNRDCIFITAPTGSGKTTFILETLLPHFASKGRRILYLVNRRILKRQLEDEILKLPHEYHTAIEIALYQEIEKEICSIKNSKMYKGDETQEGYNSQLEKFSNCDCVVCDEAHYFLTDSNYNTNTSVSFLWIQAKFGNKLSIFMSATCSEIQSFVQKDNFYKEGAGYTAYYNICKLDDTPSLSNLIKAVRESKGEEIQDDLEEKRPITTYDIARNYDYIAASNIRIINNRDDIVDLVAEGSGKWLIFIDSIKQGKKLRAAIIRKLDSLTKEGASENAKSKVVLISSGYKRDIDGDKEVDHIIKKKVPLSKVLITTSVLDNGVNIKDIELRNVILFADSETEFIQMLGRKRKDGLPLNLYIYRYGKKHFCKREKQLEQRKKIADDYLTYIEGKIKSLKKKDGSGDWHDRENLDYINDYEKKCVERQHIKLMQGLSDHYINYKDLSSAFTVYGGKWYLNRLSFQNIENLHSYYQEIIKGFEVQGEDSFVRKQLHWLGKDKEAEDIIKEAQNSQKKKAFDRITAKIQEAGMEWMTRDECKELKNEIKWDLQYILNIVERESIDEEHRGFYTTVDGMIYRKSSHINPDHVEFLNKYCDFRFKLEERDSVQGKKGKEYRFVDLKVMEKDKDKK